MASVAAAAAESSADFFRTYMIPDESGLVKKCVQKAGEYGKKEGFFQPRLLSAALLTAAVALSCLNTIVYACRAPFRVLANIASFNPILVVTDLMMQMSNIARSFIYISVGLAFVPIGLSSPSAISDFIAPPYEITTEALLRKKVEELNGKIQALKDGLANKDGIIRTQDKEIAELKEIIRKQDEKISGLKG